MRGGVVAYLVGALVLIGVAGCSGTWFQEREPWRREAEVACLKSGAVREGPAIAQLRPIQGPGTCGADFPLKVSALGEGPVMSFADELRPPAAIPQARAAPAPISPNYSPVYRDPPPQPSYRERYPGLSDRDPYAPPRNDGASQSGRPMSIHPPGTDTDDNEFDDADDAPQPTYRPPGSAQPSYRPPVSAEPLPPLVAPRASESLPPYGAPRNEPLPPLGPSRAPARSSATGVSPAATLACPMVSALDQWLANGVQPAALRWFGQPVVEIKQISAYACRGMNGVRGARISEHAFGNALDVAAFTLADGRKVTVKNGWRGLPEERGFLHDVHAAACRQFSTVLGPGSNAFHYDHLHVDLMRRASGRGICNPAPIPGDLVATRGDPGITGSIKARERLPLGFADERTRASLPHAVPGED